MYVSLSAQVYQLRKYEIVGIKFHLLKISRNVNNVPNNCMAEFFFSSYKNNYTITFNEPSFLNFDRSKLLEFHCLTMSSWHIIRHNVWFFIIIFMNCYWSRNMNSCRSDFSLQQWDENQARMAKYFRLLSQFNCFEHLRHVEFIHLCRLSIRTPIRFLFIPLRLFKFIGIPSSSSSLRDIGFLVRKYKYLESQIKWNWLRARMSKTHHPTSVCVRCLHCKIYTHFAIMEDCMTSENI